MDTTLFPTRYDHLIIDKKWGDHWQNSDVYQPTLDVLDAIDGSNSDSCANIHTIVIPPPNVTGQLHMGHALNNTYQDLYNRWMRAKGKTVCWIPGTDHAGIATQNVVEKTLLKGEEKLTRNDLGREKFIEKVWEWKEEKGGRIIEQLHRLGASCDWSRERFTMDPYFSELVQDVFVKLHGEGLIYEAKYPVNWCCRCQTALSHEEVEHHEQKSFMYHIKYHFIDSDEYIVVATTRPETILGDVAVAFNPKDERYAHLEGKMVTEPISGRSIPLIADHAAKLSFGTGLVKVTPAHDRNDYAIGQRHNLPAYQIIDKCGKISCAGSPFNGLDRFEARKKIMDHLKKNDMVEKIENMINKIGHCYRCDSVIDSYFSDQWFVKMMPLISEIRPYLDKIEIHPPHQRKILDHWLDDGRDWCISRQIWWGHRIPVWVNTISGEKKVQKKAPESSSNSDEWVQHTDVLDTWFSSWLWAFGCWQTDDELAAGFPTDFLTTGADILFFWVIRMIIASVHFKKTIPFKKLFLHGIVRDEKGNKMSKSAGNGIDPVDTIDKYGADALRFTLMMQTAYSSDVKIANNSFELGQSFCTKLWNCTRYCLLSIPDKTVIPTTCEELLEMELDVLDKWIMCGLKHCIAEVEEKLSSMKFSAAMETMYSFVWKQFCNGYLEIVKFKIHEPKTHQVLLFVLDSILRLLFPVIPFITTELMSHLTDKMDIGLSNSQMIDRIATSFPSTNIIPDSLDTELLQDDLIVEMWGTVGRIRNLKSMYRITKGSGNFVLKNVELRPFITMMNLMTKSETITIVPITDEIDRSKYIVKDLIGIKREDADITDHLVRLQTKSKNLTDKMNDFNKFINDETLEGSKKSIKKERRKAQTKVNKLVKEIGTVDAQIQHLINHQVEKCESVS